MDERARHPVQSGFEGVGGEDGGDADAPVDVDAGRGERGSDAPGVDHTAGFEPVGDRLLAVGQGEGIDGDRHGVEVASHAVEGDELLAGERALRQVGE